VEQCAFLKVTALDARYREARAAMNRLFPVGVDLVLVDRSGNLAGIPRSTAVEAA